MPREFYASPDHRPRPVRKLHLYQANALAGNPPEGVTGKNVALRLIEGLGEEGSLHRSFEFVGEGLPSMPIHHQLTICNLMGVAKAGLFRRQHYDQRATGRGFVSTGVSAGGVLAPVLFGCGSSTRVTRDGSSACSAS